MKLKDFIKRLEDIREKHGDDVVVVMADNISVVDPVFLEGNLDKNVIVTDRE